MTRIKQFFETPKKAVISSACILAALGAVGTGTAYATSTIARTNSIGAVNAQNYAFADAGLSASGVTFTETKLEREGQLSVYDLSFYTADAKYEYDVNAETGNVYNKSKEALMSQQKATAAVQETKAVQATTAAQETQASNGDGLEAAKNTALADAGVSASSATFIKARQDYDDGRALYDIEFYTSTHKYEYEVSVNSGTIVERSVEAFRTDARGNTGNSGSYIGMERAKSIALSHAGASASAVIFSKEHQDYDDGRIEKITNTDINLLMDSLAEKMPWLTLCVNQIDVTNIGLQHSLLHTLETATVIQIEQSEKNE